MISYYDIRAAHAAMRALQNTLLRKRTLDIHFSIPKVWTTRDILDLKFQLFFSTFLIISLCHMIGKSIREGYESRNSCDF